MKKIQLYASSVKALFVACALGLTSCGEDGLNSLFLGPGEPLPSGAVPSETFQAGTAPAEDNEADAAVYTIAADQSPYESVELFGDGRFLIKRRVQGYGARQKKATAKVQRKADGSISVPTPRLSLADYYNDAYYDDAYISGTYTSANGIYDLYDSETMTSFRIGEESEGVYTLTYFENGRVSTVYCNKEPQPDWSQAAKSLCRTWDTLYWDFWFVYKGKARIHVNYDVQTGAYSGDVDDEDFDYEDEDSGVMAYKVTFSKNGTYVCYFRDPYGWGKDVVDVRKWEWVDPAQGTLHWDWDENGDSDDTGFVTVRFAGSMARFYEQYTVTEDGITCTNVVVTTLQAAR